MKRVEETFAGFAGIFRLHFTGGQTIDTTAEHPLFAVGVGWIEAWKLAPGTQVLCADGSTVTLEAIVDTGEWLPVFNLRIADHHTYFVGDAGWGFSVWAHNACAKVYWYPKGLFHARFPHLSVETTTVAGKKVHTELIPDGKNNSKVALLDGGEAMSTHQREFNLPNGDAAQAYQISELGRTGKKWDLNHNCFSHVATVLMKGGVPYTNEKEFLRQMEDAFGFKIQDGP